MRISEALLRLGCSLVAWMVLYAYFLWLAVLHSIGCGPDNDEMHRLLLGMVPLAIGFSFLLRVTRPFPEIHQMLRWLSLPLLLLLPFIVNSVWSVLARSTLGAISLCTDMPAAPWEELWAPIQFLSLIFCSWMIFRTWRSMKSNRETESSTGQ